jgi:hypothetical protein
MVKNGKAQHSKRLGNHSQNGGLPVHKSNQKLVCLLFSTWCLAPCLKYHLICLVVFQNWDPLRRASEANKSLLSKYFSLIGSTQRPSAFWYSFEIHLSSSIMFINFVLSIPKPHIPSIYALWANPPLILLLSSPTSSRKNLARTLSMVCIIKACTISLQTSVGLNGKSWLPQACQSRLRRGQPYDPPWPWESLLSLTGKARYEIGSPTRLQLTMLAILTCSNLVVPTTTNSL